MLREKTAFPPKYGEPTTPRPLCPLIVWLDPYIKKSPIGQVLHARSCSVNMTFYITLLSFSNFCCSSLFLISDQFPRTSNHLTPARSVTSAPQPAWFCAPRGGAPLLCDAHIQTHFRFQFVSSLGVEQNNKNHVCSFIWAPSQTTKLNHDEDTSLISSFFSDTDSAYLYFRWCS